MPQQTILDRQAFGNPGDFFTNSPRRALGYILESADPTNNVFGRVFSHVDGKEGSVIAGLAGANIRFAGYLVNNKEHLLEGTLAGVLESRNYLRNGVSASICSMGEIYVKVSNVSKIGDIVIYAEADGALSTIAPGVAVPAGSQFGNAVVTRFDPVQQDPIDSLYLAAITITDTPLRP